MKAKKVTKVKQDFRTLKDGGLVKMILDCDNKILLFTTIPNDEIIYKVELPDTTNMYFPCGMFYAKSQKTQKIMIV